MEDKTEWVRGKCSRFLEGYQRYLRAHKRDESSAKLP